jgi:hypothetical protein
MSKEYLSLKNSYPQSTESFRGGGFGGRGGGMGMGGGGRGGFGGRGGGMGMGGKFRGYPEHGGRGHWRGHWPGARNYYYNYNNPGYYYNTGYFTPIYGNYNPDVNYCFCQDQNLIQKTPLDYQYCPPGEACGTCISDNICNNCNDNYQNYCPN